MSTDIYWMSEALKLAAIGKYTTSPNPSVGCVLVKDEQCVGKGYHPYVGAAHAEVYALCEAGEKARGATCYVTLEPCAHHGRTGPCCEALVSAGVRKVVIALRDPNPKVNGQGIAYLRQHGIKVIEDVLAEQARQLNKGFFCRFEKNRPWVTVKMAMTLDGMAADFNGESQWISSETSRVDVQNLRASHDAILTSIHTVLTDDPRLTVRVLPEDLDLTLQEHFKQPLRVVLDRQLKLTDKMQLLKQTGKTMVYTISDKPISTDAEVQIKRLTNSSKTCLNLPRILRDLACQEINSVLVESGGTLVGNFLEANLVDELVLYIVPKLLGIHGKKALAIDRHWRLPEACLLQTQSISLSGEDIKAHYINSESSGC